MKENIFVGDLAQSMDKSNAVSVDRVKVWLDDANYYRSPNVTDAQWDAMTGQIIETTIPFGTQAIADSIRSQLNGYTYVPMTVKGATIDPCAELGDAITVGGVYGIISTLDSTLNDRNASDVINPEIKALQQEYDYTESTILKQERQGVVIEGKVSFVDLETSGSTTINGDNITTGHLSADRIQSGTLTLGGQNNQYGQLYIKDENNVTIGEWNNGGVVIRDDSPYGFLDEPKFQLARENTNNTYGVRIGAMQLRNSLQPGSYPNESLGYLSVDYTYDGTTLSNYALLSPQTLSFVDGATNKTIIVGDVANNATDATVTRTGGSCTNFTYTIKTYGRVAFLSLHLNASGTSVASGGSYFTGTLSAYKPLATVSSGAMWFEHPVGATLDTSGNIIVRELAWSSSAFSNGAIDVSFTYLF